MRVRWRVCTLEHSCGVTRECSYVSGWRHLSCGAESTLYVGDFMINGHDDAEVRGFAEDRSSGEAAPEEAEQFRRQAEEAREVRDLHREARETHRQEREEFRRTAEAARVASEEARNAAETARTAREEARDATDAERQ